MLRVHKIRLQPNQAQAQYLARACGVARFAWNWAMAEWQKQYEALATFSDGTAVLGRKALGNLLHRLQRQSRSHSRKKKGSANRRKSAQALARLHWRIANVRADVLHKLSDRLTKDFSWVAIEDLHVKGMLANHKLARHIADAGFGELRRQLAYKAEQRGSPCGR